MAIAPSIVAAVFNAGVVAGVQCRLPQVERTTPIRIAIPVSVTLGGRGCGDCRYQKRNRTDSIAKTLCDHVSSLVPMTSCHGCRVAQQFEYRATRRKRKPLSADRFRH